MQSKYDIIYKSFSVLFDIFTKQHGMKPRIKGDGMKAIRWLKSIDISKIPYIEQIRSLSEFFSSVIIILMHIYSCYMLTQYTEESAVTLLNVQLVCTVLLFVLQIPYIRRIWLWILLPINLILVFRILSHAPMQDFAKLYFVLILIVMLFRQIVIPRIVYQTVHLIVALFLTYILGIAKAIPHLGTYYQIFNHAVNENTIGILGLACMMHWMCFFEMLQVKTGYRLLGQMAGMILGLYYILHSGCRSALVAVVVFLLLYAVVWKPLSPRVYQVFSLLILAAMALFPIMYIRLSQQIDNIMIFGSGLLSGRESLWQPALEQIRDNPLWGAGMSEASSMHHILVELALRFGIIAAITFVMLCGQKEKRAAAYRSSRIAQISFLACMFVAFFESFFTDRYLSFFFLSFLLSAVEKKTVGDGS